MDKAQPSRFSLNLPVFVPSISWPEAEKLAAVQSGKIVRVISYVLGPKGTNIEQAARQWHATAEIEHKAESIMCKSPEEALDKCRAEESDGHLGVFWTCTVYKQLYALFFNNPDTQPWFFRHDMNLDRMLLAVKPGARKEFYEKSKASPARSITIVSHVSPAPLVHDLSTRGANVIDASSNAAAAIMCKDRADITACITTETARKEQGLDMVHEFGSPSMLFFGGITEIGRRLLESTR